MDKQDVLDAIRRCAIDNGGAPVGRMRFAALTGIRESDWAGKYWIRWGDALVEAGFAPNRLNEAYPEQHLLGQLALLVRELGHFPLANELKMRRHQDDAFPSPETFRRLGNKQELIQRLVDFCSTDAALGDVEQICAPLVTAQVDFDDGVPGDDDDMAKASSGFVYLVRSGKHHKIGRSNSAGRRFYEIGLQLPEQLEVVHYMETDDPVGIEAYWHQRFATRRVNGEWFLLTKADISAFKRRRRFM